MDFKRAVSAVCALALVAGTLAAPAADAGIRKISPVVVASAETFYYNNYYYEFNNINEATVTITSYTGSDSEITIPSSIYGNKVTIIDIDAFHSCENLKSITIPESVTSIDSTFKNCKNLENIYVENGNTKYSSYDGALYNKDKTELIRCPEGKTSITIPDSVTNINSGAFNGCTSLESIDIDGGNGNYSFYDGVLYNKDKTKLVRCLERKTSITIPDSVTSIGDFSFSHCVNLKSITIPSSVTSICNDAFSDCTGLTSITIPSSVTSIGNEAFEQCKSLKSIIIPSSVTSIGYYAFHSCTSLTSINIPESVTSIGYGAFRNCSSLTSISIPNSVTSIDDFTFEFCSSLTSITIPSSVKSIAWEAFSDCTNLTSITLPDSVTVIGEFAFSGCTGLTSITLPDSVTVIGEGAFLGCTNLTNIAIPDGVTSVNFRTFRNCTSLKIITIPASVTSIDEEAFEYCTSLTDVYYSGTKAQWREIDIDNVNDRNASLLNANIHYCYYSTDHGGFEYEINNGTVTIKEYSGSDLEITIPSTINGKKVTKIGDHAFDGCIYLTSVTIPDSVTSIGRYAFGTCTKLESVTIPDSVTSIGDYAFRNCSNLKSITIPNSVTSIGESAFEYCSSLTSITIPDSVTTIDWDTFLSCIELKSITIPVSVTSICQEAFYGCTSLTDVYYSGTKAQWGEISIDNSKDRNAQLLNANIHCSYYSTDHGGFEYEINNGTVTIKEYSGSDLEITIPSTINGKKVTKIGDHAFDGCIYLTSVTIPDSVTSIGRYAFGTCTKLESVTIPDSVTSIGDYAFRNCSNLKSITIPNSVTSIGESAFEYCSSLTSITIPDSVTTIDWDTFLSCIELKSITIPVSVTSICQEAFYGCTSLTDVYYSGTKAQWGEISIDNSKDRNAMLLNANIHCTDGVINPLDEPTPVYPAPAKQSISKAIVKAANKVYTGKSLTPAVTVKLNGKTLKSGTDYTVTYKNNKNCGKATVTVTGKGSYTGSKSGSFIIKPAKVTAKKLTSPKKKTIKLTWIKAKGGVTGYQVQIALNKKFSKGKKTYNVKVSAAAKTIKGLKSKKTYFARVRAYKTVDKTKYYGAWSAVKSVKCK